MYQSILFIYRRIPRGVCSSTEKYTNVKSWGVREQCVYISSPFPPASPPHHSSSFLQSINYLLTSHPLPNQPQKCISQPSSPSLWLQASGNMPPHLFPSLLPTPSHLSLPKFEPRLTHHLHKQSSSVNKPRFQPGMLQGKHIRRQSNNRML